MQRGNLIVFEGVDGSGTTTQAELLRARFARVGLPAHVTAQPSSGPVGTLIRQVLSRRLVSIGGKAPGWATMSLLFAADRQDQQENEIEPNLREGVNVICDRYVHSSVIYQGLSATGKDVRGWIHEVNRHIRKPDVVFYMRVAAAEALKRRAARNGRMEIFDDTDFQATLVSEYDRIEEFFPGSRIITIDASGTMEEIADEVWTVVEEMRAQGAPE